MSSAGLGLGISPRTGAGVSPGQVPSQLQCQTGLELLLCQGLEGLKRYIPESIVASCISRQGHIRLETDRHIIQTRIKNSTSRTTRKALCSSATISGPRQGRAGGKGSAGGIGVTLSF